MKLRPSRPSLCYFTALLSLLLAAAPPVWAQEEEEFEEVTIQATRSGRNQQNEPIKVEVLMREEIEEKIMMIPGNIAMLVSETPGVRTQVTSPSLGAANIRMQGLKGRYTQLLSDGLPLYGGQAPSIGLLQIPPTDLGQVEIVKGAASALYGPSALGGVINLVSRRPREAAEAESLLNLTSRNGLDLTGYAATAMTGEWGASLTGGFNRQDRHDLDGDGWTDMPAYERWTARPRLFFESESGARAYLTAGVMTESRQGGTMPGRTAPGGNPFAQDLDSTRFDGGAVAEIPLGDLGSLNLRASAMTQDDAHHFGPRLEKDSHQTYLTEATFTGRSDATSWLAGVAFQSDVYRSDAFPAFNHTYDVPALLGQIEHDLAEGLALAASGRLDDHSRYGTRFSPRLSALYRPGPWSFRASIGQGFFAPTPFVEGIDEVGLSRLLPLAGLKAETATAASLDAGYAAGAFQANVTLFGSDIKHAVQLRKFAIPGANTQLINAIGPTRTRGMELKLRYAWESFIVTGSYVYADATEADPAGSGRRGVPLTPRHTAGFVAMWEEHGVGRIGFESYYTGTQLLEDNPYRAEGKPYVEMGLFGEMVLGNFRLFLNLENLLDVRQTDYDPLLLPMRAPDGRWTVDAWAPAEGFVVNGGIRFLLGEH